MLKLQSFPCFTLMSHGYHACCDRNTCIAFSSGNHFLFSNKALPLLNFNLKLTTKDDKDIKAFKWLWLFPFVNLICTSVFLLLTFARYLEWECWKKLFSLKFEKLKTFLSVANAFFFINLSIVFVFKPLNNDFVS